MFFLMNRGSATTSGDKDAVRDMYRVLSKSAEELEGVGKEGLKKQLASEYGVDVTLFA